MIDIALAQLYSASGNSLWVLEDNKLTASNFLQYVSMAKTLCQNGQADGLMLFNGISKEVWILNADGSNGQFCGNGLRAVAYHLQQTLHIRAAQLFMAGHTVNAQMNDNEISITLTLAATPLKRQGDTVKGYSTALPNPHLVFVNPPKEWMIAEEGKALCQRYQSNVEFVYLYQDTFQVLVYERGVGVTKACGSGALAVFKVLQALHLVDIFIKIKMAEHELTVRQVGDQLCLTGQVHHVLPVDTDAKH